MNAANPEAETAPRGARRKTSWRHEAGQWIILILIVLGIHSFVAKPFYIPSESMLPTLLVGDRLIVSKYPYGYSYMSPSVPILPKIKGRLFGHMPMRGDIVVLKSPSDGADWIKRVVGLPGDVVEVRDGAVILNGQPIARQRVANTDLLVTPNTDCTYTPQFRTVNAAGQPICSYPTYRETLTDGHQYDTLDLGYTDRDNFGPFPVPPGHVFLMGDNRDNSMDSRVPPELGGLGAVPIENIIGRAEFTTFSLNGSQTLNPLTWWGALRGDRAFLSLRK